MILNKTMLLSFIVALIEKTLTIAIAENFQSFLYNDLE